MKVAQLADAHVLRSQLSDCLEGIEVGRQLQEKVTSIGYSGANEAVEALGVLLGVQEDYASALREAIGWLNERATHDPVLAALMRAPEEEDEEDHLQSVDDFSPMTFAPIEEVLKAI